MDIAAMSIHMNMASLQQAASLSVAKKTMNMQEQATDALLQMVKTATPSFGQRLDVRA
ncbi:MAG: YjfB family protein [Angelakisella sp.]